jgi:EmrB/QacA subfamily drug resistance transporter
MSSPTTALAADPRRWWILAVMLTAEIMDLLDSTIVNVAGPSLKHDLGATPSQLQWIIGGYALALGASLVLGGRLGDRYGRRSMFLVGIVTFTATSLLCAVAPTNGWLITFRLLEGVAAAMLLPQGFGLIRQAFPPEEFGKAFAVFGPVFGLGGILGPIVGGFIIQSNLFNIGWRDVFLVNIPIGVVATVLAWRMLPRQAGDQRVTIDLVSAALIASASGLLVLPLIQGQQAGWPLWTWLSFLAAAVGFVAFYLRNRHVARGDRAPLVDPSIFAYRSYTTGVGGLFLFFAGFTGVYLVITLYLQIGEGYSASGAALGNVPIALGTALGGMLSGAVLAEKFGRKVLQAGAVFQLLGAALLLVGLRDITHFHLAQLVAGMLVGGFGTGLVVAALFDTIISAISGRAVGSASGFLSAVQSVASSVGVAVFGTAFFAGVTDHHSPLIGFRRALEIQLFFVAAFLVVTFFLPAGQKENAWDGVEETESYAQPPA